MPPHASRTIFVANVPFDVSEEQLANVFSEAGPVNSVEIKFDPQTGRSKGYAFVQFYDDATAASAVRNLQDVPVNGRNLRVEPSTDEPGPRRRGGGGGGGGGAGAVAGGGGGRGPPSSSYGPGPGGPAGPGVGGPPAPIPFRRDDYQPHPPAPLPVSAPGPIDVNLNLLPPGQELLPGQTALDSITKTLAAISPGQMQDVMASMKTLVNTNPEQARQLLSSKPQLAYALFQAMLLMNIVDESVLNRIKPLPPAHNAVPPAAAYPPPAAQGYPTYPPHNAPPAPAPYQAQPTNSYRPPQAQGYAPPPPAVQSAPGYGGGYGAPPPAPAPAQGMAGLPPSAQAALATLPEEQRTMLVQVLQLSPDQVNALDPTQKASIIQLRQQFLGTA